MRISCHYCMCTGSLCYLYRCFQSIVNTNQSQLSGCQQSANCPACSKVCLVRQYFCNYYNKPKYFRRIMVVLALSLWMVIFDSVAEKRLERRQITRALSLPINCLPVSLTLTSVLTNPPNCYMETLNQTRYIYLYSATLHVFH